MKNLKSKSNFYFYFGFFIFIFFISIYYLFTRVLPFNIFKKNKNEYCLIFKDIEGLPVGAPVRIAGVKVGYVKNIRLFNGKAKVIIAVDRNVKLTNNTKASIESDSLLGENYIALYVKLGKVLPPRACINNTYSDTFLDTFNELSKVNITQLNLLISSTYRLVKNLNSDQHALMVQINKTLENVNKNLNRLTLKTIEFLNRTDSILTSFNQSLTKTSTSYRKLALDLDRSLLYLSKDLNSSLRSFNNTLKNINFILNTTKKERVINKLAVTLNKTQNSIDTLHKILTRIYYSNGTFWKIVEDKKLFKNLNSSLAGLENIEKKLNNVLSQKYVFYPKFDFYITSKREIRYSILGTFKFKRNSLDLGFTQLTNKLGVDVIYSRYLIPNFAVKCGLYESKLAVGTKIQKYNYFLDTYYIPFLQFKVGANIKYLSFYLGCRYLYHDNSWEPFVGTNIKLTYF